MWVYDAGLRVKVWADMIMATAAGSYLLTDQLTAPRYCYFLENIILQPQVLPVAEETGVVSACRSSSAI
jgi:hypothetical protein